MIGVSIPKRNDQLCCIGTNEQPTHMYDYVQTAYDPRGFCIFWSLSVSVMSVFDG
jgi:hypothetical protein